MANISLRERLQPALLDRLHDDERAVHVIELTVDSASMTRLQLVERDLVTALQAGGLRQLAPGNDAGTAGSAAAAHLTFTAPAGSFQVARLKALPVARPTGPKAVLGDVCAINVRTVTSTAIESAERRMISMRRLRESVLRDLEWLFNTLNLEATDNLDAFPEMRRSVLNYGMPPLTGRLVTAIDPLQAAADIAEVIRNFEPRLSHVRVVPEVDQARMDSRTITFRIEAELWGQPTPQQLLLRTQLDVHSRDLKVTESASG